MYSDKHVQEPVLCCSRHIAFAPHGDGEHAVGLSVCISTKIKKNVNM